MAKKKPKSFKIVLGGRFTIIVGPFVYDVSIIDGIFKPSAWMLSILSYSWDEEGGGSHNDTFTTALLYIERFQGKTKRFDIFFIYGISRLLSGLVRG